MAQKFGNFRWIKEGFLDGRTEGLVVGRIVFAGLGPVEMCLTGMMTGEIDGKIIRFENSTFLDDPRAIETLADFETPQVGKVSLISFDPHPLVAPHPYIEWFSVNRQHYRIELAADDARILSEEESAGLDQEIEGIRTALLPLLQSTTPTSSPAHEWY